MPDGVILTQGPLVVQVQDGGLRAITCNGIEVLRGLTYPVRNADWGTHLTLTTNEVITSTTYTRQFTDLDGTFSGVFQTRLMPDHRIESEVTFTFNRIADINRAGFTLLHPIRGIAGSPLTIRHPDGRAAVTTFPALISPAQPARDITGLTHAIHGTTVHIDMEGDVFEMEDQRNWSDASFKTYCRPLSRPYPYPVAEGEVIRQRITLTLSPAEAPAAAPSAPSNGTARMPQVLLAYESGLTSPASLDRRGGLPVLFRLTPETPASELNAMSGSADICLEIVFNDLPDLATQIARVQAAGLAPARVTALPRAFLKSYQPDATWPSGTQPRDAIPALRAAFPMALIGGGSLTNFTELNRHRPDPATVDFCTFGNTAIVHAADDLSVWQTLEALPDIFASAHAIAAGKPLHLGLHSIGMRSNPYGTQVAPNPDGLRLPMAMSDPRQAAPFAAAYAVAILALAARANVSSIALAMTDGPLGTHGPLSEILKAAHGMVGQPVAVTESEGVFQITTPTAGLAANTTRQPVPPPRPGLPPLAAESALTWTA